MVILSPARKRFWHFFFPVEKLKWGIPNGKGPPLVMQIGKFSRTVNIAETDPVAKIDHSRTSSLSAISVIFKVKP